jgi:hypothetical protein
VHAGVGAPGAGEGDGPAHDRRDGAGQLTHHGAHAGIGREAVEPTPVVRDGQASAPHLGQGMAVRIASFNVEDFGTERVQALTMDEIEERLRAFQRITRFEVDSAPTSMMSAPSFTSARACATASPGRR